MPTQQEIEAARIRSAQRDEARQAAEKQAYEDARVRPADPSVKIPKGEQVPLHLLNTRAKAQRAAERKLNKAAAQAAAKAVAETLQKGEAGHVVRRKPVNAPDAAAKPTGTGGGPVPAQPTEPAKPEE